MSTNFPKSVFFGFSVEIPPPIFILKEYRKWVFLFLFSLMSSIGFSLNSLGEPSTGLIYNILHNGITVLSGETADLNFTENVSHLPPGFYIITATDGLKWYNKHFVVIH